MKFTPPLAIIWLLIFSACAEEHSDPNTGNNTSTPVTPTLVTTDALVTDYGDSASIQTDSLLITGRVVSTDAFGTLANRLHIQDNTGAIIIEVEASELYLAYPVGLALRFNCTGLAVDPASRSLHQPDGSKLTSAMLSERVIPSTDISKPTAKPVLFPRGMLDQDIGSLVYFNNTGFDEVFIGEPFLNGNTTTLRNVTNPFGDEVTILLEANSVFTGESIPSERGRIYGLVVKKEDALVIVPRSLEDIDLTIPWEPPYAKATFSFGENFLPYQIMFPREYDSLSSYPLVIFLHGAGERGADNERQMAYGPLTFGSLEAREDYPAIVIFPQCPSDVMWSRRTKEQIDNTWVFDFPVEEEPNYAMEMVIELVRELLANEAVDPNRVYVAGLSMGGIGAFEFSYYAPDLPAAVVSIAGGHDPNLVDTYAANMAFWLFHGTNDTVVPVKYSEDLYAKFTALGYDAQFTKADGRGHEWNYVLNDPAMIDWLFNQTKEN